MTMINRYSELKASYLSVDIAHNVAAYQEAHPEKEIIRLGIGDVTQPLANCVVNAMHDAVTDMGTKEGFHGYWPLAGVPLPHAGHAWLLRKPVAPSWTRMRSSSPTVPIATSPVCWACST